jgi:hypothetical protein
MSIGNRTLEIAYTRGYLVDEYGNLFSPNGKQIKTSKDKDGYEKYSIRINGKKRSFTVHRLAGFQLFGLKVFRSDLEVRHLDGNPANNILENLALGTHLDNMRDVPKELRKRRSSSGRKEAIKKIRKFNDAEIRSIRLFHNNYQYSMSELAEKYEVAKSTISYIINRRTYRDVV